MKILFTSDWHVDASTAGVERMPELAEYVSSLELAIEEEGVDLVVNAGDSWDPGSVHDPRWGRFVYESFNHLAFRARYHREDADGPGLIAIPGNHDVVDIAEPTSTLSPLRVARSPGVLVLEEPTAWSMVHAGQRVLFLALPYVSRAYERTDDYKRALGGALEAAEKAARNSPVVVIGHLAFEGMVPGSESTDMARGREVPFPVVEVGQVNPALVVNGHYHARQTIRRGSLDIEIPGAPIRFTFGEARDGARGFLTAEV